MRSEIKSIKSYCLTTSNFSISRLRPYVSYIILLLCIAGKSFAQVGQPLDSAATDSLLAKCATKYPKFYKEFVDIKKHDELIKNFIFMKTNGTDNGPAKAGPKGNIFIDAKYLEKDVPGFDDNRLIVVLYHEIGHLHYFMRVQAPDRNPQDSEQAAFEYSLLKTKELAEKGDCLPLKTGVRFMKLRSEGTNLQDPHVRALKRMVQEPLYASYAQYVKDKCPDQ